jgi:RNA polymerase sigma factor for flagellar operon FliA
MDKAELLSQHQGLVINLARKLAFKYRLSAHTEEMISFGNNGLLDAAERFDPSRGFAFSTFAYYRIRGAMLDGARAMGWLKRQRRSQLLGDRVFNEQRQTQFEDNPLFASDSLDDIARDLDQAVTQAGLIVMLSEHSARSAADAEHNQRPDSRYEQEQAFETLRGFIQRLSSEDREIIEMTFFQECSTDEIGQRLGCSKSWACRRRQAALERLRLMWLEES